MTHEAAHPLAGKTVVLGVAGGIAAYKSVELLRLLTKAGAMVRVVMTPSARQFVGELTFQALSGHPVFTDLFDLSQESEIGHIQVADGADLVIVAPATANVISRAVVGAANDVLTAVLLATRAPTLLAPSMNVNMWEHPATRANVETLSGRGVYIVGPGTGFLACRWTGPGRLAEPADIVEAACRILSPADLAGRHVVVSAGPTHEPLDPVRYLGNRSSGKMGYAVARAAVWRGAEVTLVSGPSSQVPPPGVTLCSVNTAEEMARAIQDAARNCDAVVMAAAVADWRPRVVSAQKISKTAGGLPALEFEANTDILAELGRSRGQARRPVLVGFAAQTGAPEQAARAKLQSKQCDLIVANDVSLPDAGFEVDTNRVTLVDAAGAQPLGLDSKDAIAHKILDRVTALLKLG